MRASPGEQVVMATPVVMPQMGESIAEGTIVRWIKKVGDSVDRDEPLFEISTDKVDAKIPSPAAGVLMALFFPAPFHLLRQGHIGHHLRNRSDDEAFDLYFDGDNVVWRWMMSSMRR